MPKYSIGDGGHESGACEICGESADDLTDATISGADLRVCDDCATHGVRDQTDSSPADQPASDSMPTSADPANQEDEPATQSPAHRNTGPDTSLLWDSDTSHWEESGVNYERNRLPHLVPDYAECVRTARLAADLSPADLVDELAITEQELSAIEQGEAATAGIGGSIITMLEDSLEVTLTENK